MALQEVRGDEEFISEEIELFVKLFAGGGFESGEIANGVFVDGRSKGEGADEGAEGYKLGL